MFFKIVRPLITIFLWLFYPFKVRGKQNVIHDGNTVIICNHLGKMDVPMVGYIFKGKTYYLAKKEWFNKTEHIPFEKTELRVPIGLHEFLTERFGDYMIPPSEERIRFMDALAQDLSRTITAIDGVVDARVHVVLPDNDPFSKKNLPSSAAVAIRARWDADLSNVIPSIKSLVKNAIEGLQYEKISVTIFNDSPPKSKK